MTQDVAGPACEFAVHPCIPLVEFAQAMLGAHDAFAERVGHFGHRFGSVSPDTLALLAQAAYFCWFEAEYEADLLSLCLAIGQMKPSSVLICQQISVQRWHQLNSYVGGVQRWLGRDLSASPEADPAVISKVKDWLGAPNPAKRALAQLFLCSLIDHLVLRSSLTVLGDRVTAGTSLGGRPSLLSDVAVYRHWYARCDGRHYTLGHDHDDGGQAGDDPFVQDLKDRAHCEMDDMAVAQGLIDGILRPSQPPCHHRFQRYLEIQIASIGALKWRGKLPADDSSKERWQHFWGEAEPALDAWAGGVPAGDLPQSRVAARIYQALGEPSEEKRTIIREFLRQPPPGGPYGWLRRRLRRDGRNVACLLDDPPLT